MIADIESIKVLIVDDHRVVRQGLRTFLDLNDDIQVVGEAGDGQEAVDLAAQLKPDIVLMDLVMPRLDGIAATSRIKALGQGTKVIALPGSPRMTRSSRPSRLALPVICSRMFPPTHWWSPSVRRTAARHVCIPR